jgi:hypothetical protein
MQPRDEGGAQRAGTRSSSTTNSAASSTSGGTNASSSAKPQSASSASSGGSNASSSANAQRGASASTSASAQGAATRPNAAAAAAAAIYRPPSSIVPSSGPGLRLSWIVFRGKAAAVSFDPVQMKTWTDTRAYGNSPWSPPFTIPLPPPDGKWTTSATFQEPGTYVLRAVASDGSLFTYDNVTVTVTR